jgi:hypothetical protein
MIRNECSPDAEQVIDELWRVIKLMYGGSTRQEALAARMAPKKNTGVSSGAQVVLTSKVYALVLKYLNPESEEAKTATLEDLTFAFRVIDSQIDNPTEAQSQVAGQLAKAIGRVVSYKDGSVVDAIRRTWEEREMSSRAKLALSVGADEECVEWSDEGCSKVAKVGKKKVGWRRGGD